MRLSWSHPPITQVSELPNHSLLVEKFIYYSERLGGDVVIQPPFHFDWDSVPRLPLMYWIFKGRARVAALIHDDLYARQPVSRRTADLVFLDAMKAEGVARRHYWGKYLAVRVGGWLGWRRSERKK